MRKKLFFILALAVLMIVCSSAGCVTVKDPGVSIINLESDDGIYWNTSALITNYNGFAVVADLEYILYDKEGNIVGYLEKQIPSIAPNESKSDLVTIKSSHQINYGYVQATCEINTL